MEQILATDNYHEVARKMFYEYQVGQSCTVAGICETKEGEIMPKGEAACNELRKLDRIENFVSNKGARGGGMRRRRDRPDNQIGDYIANKAFRYSHRGSGAQIKYMIWRVQ